MKVCFQSRPPAAPSGGHVRTALLGHEPILEPCRRDTRMGLDMNRKRRRLVSPKAPSNSKFVRALHKAMRTLDPLYRPAFLARSGKAAAVRICSACRRLSSSNYGAKAVFLGFGAPFKIHPKELKNTRSRKILQNLPGTRHCRTIGQLIIDSWNSATDWLASAKVISPKAKRHRK